MIRLFQNLFVTSYNSESKDLEELQIEHHSNYDMAYNTKNTESHNYFLNMLLPLYL